MSWSRSDRLARDLAVVAQIICVLRIGDHRRVARRLVHDVGRRRVGEMLERAHVAGDRAESPSHRNSMNTAGGMKPLDRHRAPAEAAELGVHFRDERNAVGGDSRFLEAVEVFWLRVLGEKRLRDAQDETPARVVDRRVERGVLLHDVGMQVFGNFADRLCFARAHSSGASPPGNLPHGLLARQPPFVLGSEHGRTRKTAARTRA